MPEEVLNHIVVSFDVRNYLSLVALVIAGLDWIGSLCAEYQHVWKKRFTATTFVYLWSRYAALVTFIIHYIFIHIFLARGPISPLICRSWFWFVAMSCTSLQTSLVAILFLRVWAVYRQNIKLVIGVGVIVALPFVVSFELIGRNAAHAHNFNDHCDLHRTPIEAAPLAAVFFLSHLVLWFTIFRKRNFVMPNDRRLMDTVVNTGNASFSVLTIIVLMIPWCFATDSVNIVLVFILPMLPISMLSCKMVINMFRLRTGHPSKFLDTSEVVLTSVFATSFESHELRTRVSDSF